MKLANESKTTDVHMLRNRRQFLLQATALGASPLLANAEADEKKKAQIVITYDLEMSRHYPKRGITEWDYQKGNLDEATKEYSLESAKRISDLGGKIHYFCVVRVLEQSDISWLTEINELGHPIGNHTYDHVNVTAKTAAQTQFRFQRSPWLVQGKTAFEIILENIRLAEIALQERAGIKCNGFRTPGGFYKGLQDSPEIRKLLMALGYEWISAKYPPHQSERGDDGVKEPVYENIVAAQKNAQPFRYDNDLLEIPMSPISDVTAFRSKFWQLDEFKHAIKRSVMWAIETGGVFDFLCHPSCMVIEDPKFETILMMADLVKQHSDRAELVTLDKVADRYKS